MSNKEVIDWVRSEKAEGLSDTQLKVALIKKGYSGKDVDKLVDITHKKKINWAPFITLFIISMVLFFVMGFISKINNAVVIFSFGLVLALIYSEIIHHNSNQKEPFIELFIVNFFSMVFSLSLAILFFNLLVFLLYITKTKVIFPLLILIPSICIIILIYVFYFTVAFVSKRFVGYFDSESYFIFKHWPIKILNVDWKDTKLCNCFDCF